jgi:hypothetical protein
MRWLYSTDCLAGISLLYEGFDEEKGEGNESSFPQLGPF